MTVTYTAKVATSSKGLGCFWKLLFLWRGSIYKLVWHELMVYCFCYTLVSLVYRLALTDPQKRVFEGVAMYMSENSTFIPMAFVLGFYVSIIMTRWWDQYSTIPWPDTIAVFVSTNIHGQNEKARVMRRTIMRYVNLSYCITMSMISPPIKKRFPSMEHLVELGLMTEQEQMIFEIMDTKTAYSKYWLPLVWAGAIVSKARKEGRIRDDFAVKTIMDEINNFRKGCGRLTAYDKISVPLVYTQVVTLAVYTFFLSTIVSRQFLDPEQGIKGHIVDLYVPWFTILQFFFYMGWLKVAESLIDPFGEDDDDFEINSLVDRNIVVAYLIVDEMHEEHPELIKDMYFEGGVPMCLPYTLAAEPFRTGPNHGSTFDLKVPERQQEILETLKEEPEPKPVKTVSNVKTVPSKLAMSTTPMLGTTPTLKIEMPHDPLPPSPEVTKNKDTADNVSSHSSHSGLTTPGRKNFSFFGNMVRRMSSTASKLSDTSRVRSSQSIKTLSGQRSAILLRSTSHRDERNAATGMPADIEECESLDGSDIIAGIREHNQQESEKK